MLHNKFWRNCSCWQELKAVKILVPKWPHMHPNLEKDRNERATSHSKHLKHPAAKPLQVMAGVGLTSTPHKKGGSTGALQLKQSFLALQKHCTLLLAHGRELSLHWRKESRNHTWQSPEAPTYQDYSSLKKKKTSPAEKVFATPE